jgi:isopentenyl diphosphate isomerase/L-lactate dehydrogenase-like FMN-dependent dehydrogenase
MQSGSKRTVDALNIEELRQAAQTRLAAGVYAFLERGVEDDVCIAANRAAFRDITLQPRVLRGVAGIDMSTEILGQRICAPMAIAPTGGNAMLWYRGDQALARAAAAAGIPFTISTASSIDVEDIAQAGGRLWFQLYMWEDRQLSHAAMDRAWGAGCDTLFVTSDMAVPPNREFMRRMGFGLPFKVGRRSFIDIACHPKWSLGVMGRYMLNGGLPRQANLPAELKGTLTRDPKRRASFVNDTLDWEEVKGLRDRWKGKFIIKGIMRGEDAEQALAIGADGVVVSNHGGRSLDSSAPTIKVLPEVVKAIGGRGTIFFDSGIRRGTDIVKALALGANAVLLGRAPLYGLAAAGQAGVEQALDILKTEIGRTMGLTGSRTITDLSAELLAPA